jgi:hypothetical protein
VTVVGGGVDVTVDVGGGVDVAAGVQAESSSASTRAKHDNSTRVLLLGIFNLLLLLFMNNSMASLLNCYKNGQE